MRIFNIVLIALMVVGSTILADDFTDLVDKGNQAYLNGDFNSALDNYHQAEVERPETAELYYNMGNALFNEGKYEEALENLEQSLVTDNVIYEAQAHYNIGNTHYTMGDYEKAIESYQNSLKLYPDDLDAKFNLELARKMLKEQMKQQNKDQQKQQQKQEEKQEQPKPEESDEPQEEQQEQPQPQTPEEYDENEMTEEDAERILNALEDDEKELQKDQKRFKSKGNYNGKNW